VTLATTFLLKMYVIMNVLFRKICSLQLEAYILNLMMYNSL